MPRARDRDPIKTAASLAPASPASTGRRQFLGRMTGAAAVLAMAPPLTMESRVSARVSAGPTPGAVVPQRGHESRGPWSDAWLDKLTGKHKEFFDTLDSNDGFALAFALYFLDLNRDAYGLADSDLTAVVGLRHFAMPMALPDALWERYGIGEDMQIKDPATGGPATRNPFLHADAAQVPGADIPSLVKRGVLFTVCNVALTLLSSRMAKNAGVSKEAAKAEWAAKLVPGMILVPVGVIAVNRAQERGCSYCYGG